MDSGIYLNSLKTEIKAIKLLSDKDSDKKSRSELKEYVDEIIDTIEDDDIKIKDFQQSCQSIIQNLNGSIIQLINLSQIHLEGDYSYTGKINLKNIDMNEYLGEEVEINTENVMQKNENLVEAMPGGAPTDHRQKITPEVANAMRPKINVYTGKTYTGNNSTIEREKGKCSGPFSIENHSWFENDGENIIDKLFNNCDFDKYKINDNEVIHLTNGTNQNFYHGISNIKFIPFLYLVYTWTGWKKLADAANANLVELYRAPTNREEKTKLENINLKIPYTFVSTLTRRNSYSVYSGAVVNHPVDGQWRIIDLKRVIPDISSAENFHVYAGSISDDLTNNENKRVRSAGANIYSEYYWGGLRGDYSGSKYSITKSKESMEIIKRFINLTITKLPIYYFDCKKEINELNSIYSVSNLLKNLLLENLENGVNNESRCDYPEWEEFDDYINTGNIFKVLLNKENSNLIKKGKNQKTKELKDYDIKIHNFDNKELDYLKFINLMKNNWKIGYPLFEEKKFDINRPNGFPVSNDYKSNPEKCPSDAANVGTWRVGGGAGGRWTHTEGDAWKKCNLKTFTKDVNDSLSVYFEEGITESKFFILEFRHKLSDSNNVLKSRLSNTEKSYFHLVEVLKFKEAKTYSILIHMENFIRDDTITKKRYTQDTDNNYDENHYKLTSSIYKLSENNDYINVYPKPLIRTKDVIFNDISKQRYDYMIENESFTTNITSKLNYLLTGTSKLSKSPAATATISGILGTSVGLSTGLIGAMVVGLAYKNYKSNDENYGIVEDCKEYVSNYFGYNQIMDNIDINNLGLVKLKDNEKDTIGLLENTNLLGIINNRMRERTSRSQSSGDRDNEETIINKFIEISKSKINVSGNQGQVANPDSKNIKNRWMKLRDNYIQLIKKQLATYLMPIKSNYVTNVDNLYDSNIEEGISGLQNTTTFIKALNDLKANLKQVQISYDDTTIDDILNKFYGMNKDEIYQEFDRKITGLSNTPTDLRIIIPQFYDFLLPVGNIDDPSRYYDLISDSIFLNHYSLNVLEKIDNDINNPAGVGGVAQGQMVNQMRGPQLPPKKAHAGAPVPGLGPLKVAESLNDAKLRVQNAQKKRADLLAKKNQQAVGKGQDLVSQSQLREADQELQAAQTHHDDVVKLIRIDEAPKFHGESVLMPGSPPRTPSPPEKGSDILTPTEWRQLLYRPPNLQTEKKLMSINHIDTWYEELTKDKENDRFLNKSKLPLSGEMCDDTDLEYLQQIFVTKGWGDGLQGQWADGSEDAKYICDHLKIPLQPLNEAEEITLETFVITSYEKNQEVPAEFNSDMRSNEKKLTEMYTQIATEQPALLKKGIILALGGNLEGYTNDIVGFAARFRFTKDQGVNIARKLIDIYIKPAEPARMPSPDVFVGGAQVSFSPHVQKLEFDVPATGGGRKQKGGAMVGNIQRATSSPQEVDQAIREAAAGRINHFIIESPKRSNLQVSTQRTIPGEKYRKYAQQVVLYYLEPKGIYIGENISDSFIILGLYENGITNQNDINIALQIIKYIIDNYSSFYGNINKVVSKIEEESKKIAKTNDNTDNSSKKEKNVIVDEELSMYDNISGLDDIFKDFTRQYFGSLYTYFLYGPSEKEYIDNYYTPYYFYSKTLLERGGINQDAKDYLLNLLPLLPVNDINYRLDSDSIFNENNLNENDIKIENINIGTKVVNDIAFTLMECNYLTEDGTQAWDDGQNDYFPIWFRGAVNRALNDIVIKTKLKNYDFREGIDVLELNNEVIIDNIGAFDVSIKTIGDEHPDQIVKPYHIIISLDAKMISPESQKFLTDARQPPPGWGWRGLRPAKMESSEYRSLGFYIKFNIDHNNYPYKFVDTNIVRDNDNYKNIVDSHVMKYIENVDETTDENNVKNNFGEGNSAIERLIDAGEDLYGFRMIDYNDVENVTLVNNKIIIKYNDKYYKFDDIPPETVRILESIPPLALARGPIVSVKHGDPGRAANPGERELAFDDGDAIIKIIISEILGDVPIVIHLEWDYKGIGGGRGGSTYIFNNDNNYADFIRREMHENKILYSILQGKGYGPLIPTWQAANAPRWRRMNDSAFANYRPYMWRVDANSNKKVDVMVGNPNRGTGQIYPTYIEHNYVTELSNIRVLYMAGMSSYKAYINIIRYIYSSILYRYKIIKVKTIDNLLKIFEMYSLKIDSHDLDHNIYIRAIIHSYFFEEKVKIVTFEDYVDIMKYTVDVINILNSLFFSYDNDSVNNLCTKSQIHNILKSMIEKSSTIEFDNSLSSIKKNSNMKCDNIFFKNTNMCPYNPENRSFWVKPENIKVPHIDYIINKLKLRYVLRIFYKNKRIHDSNISKINKFRKEKLSLLQRYMPDTLGNLYNNVMKFRKTNDKKEITKGERNKGSSDSSDSSKKQERIEGKKSESKTISKGKNKFKVGDIVSLPDNSIGKIIKIMDNKQYQVKKRDGSIITIKESDLKLYKEKEKEKEKEKSKFNISDNVLIISKNKMGEIIGITSDGKYIIKLEDGTIIEINSSDIRIIDGEIKKGDNVKLSNGNIGELVGITPSGDYIIKLKNGTVISISNKKSIEKIKIKKEEIKRDESVDVDKLQNELDSLIIDKQRNEKLILQLNEDLRNYKLERNGLESEERQKRLRDYERKQKELNYIKNSLYLKNKQVKSLKLLIEKEIERNKMIEENKLNSKLLDEKRNIELMKKKMYDISKKDHERNKLLKTGEKDKEIELLRKKNKEYEELMKKNKVSFNKYKRDESLDESIPIYSIKRTPKKVKANISKKKKSDKKKNKSSLDDSTKTLKKIL